MWKFLKVAGVALLVVATRSYGAEVSTEFVVDRFGCWLREHRIVV